MKDQKHGKSIAVLALLVLYFASCRQVPEEVRLADYVISQHLLTQNDSAIVLSIANSMLSGTKWRDQVQINKPYQADRINFYVFSGQSSAVSGEPLMADLVGKGLFIRRNIIFLDDDYLQSFLSKHHVRPDAANNSLMDDQYAFLCWIIGHELGHLLCGHLHGQFDPGPLEAFVKTSSIDNLQELQADSVFIHLTIPNKRLGNPNNVLP